MTQKIFDTDNKEDMALLWSILPDDVERITPVKEGINHVEFVDDEFNTILLNINWHGKTEITRPIKEATEADIGKICAFWEYGYKRPVYSELHSIEPKTTYKYIAVMDSNGYEHCRRLTKQEIEELC